MKRDKMKTKSIISLAVLVVTSAFFISVPPTYAGDCSAEDPCGTWAVLDSSGTVVNVIVCQPSVCGQGDLGGQRVVQQQAANPVTHDNYGVHGYRSDENQTVTESSGVFTIENNVTGSKTSFQTTFNQSQTLPETFTSVSVDFNGDSANINATETTIVSTKSESLELLSKISKAEFEAIVNTSEFVILQNKINMLTKLMENWLSN
jgi:hypothetical protein